MLTSPGDDTKKQIILDILANEPEKMYDKKFKFEIKDTFWFQ